MLAPALQRLAAGDLAKPPTNCSDATDWHVGLLPDLLTAQTDSGTPSRIYEADVRYC